MQKLCQLPISGIFWLGFFSKPVFVGHQTPYPAFRAQGVRGRVGIHTSERLPSFIGIWEVFWNVLKWLRIVVLVKVRLRGDRSRARSPPCKIDQESAWDYNRGY
jgi:hypothetical protein